LKKKSVNVTLHNFKQKQDICKLIYNLMYSFGKATEQLQMLLDYISTHS